MLDYEWHDFFGNLGVLLIIGSYFWLQIGRISGQNPAYSLVNAIGAALVLISLYYEFNLSAALIESFWLLISLLGLFLGTRSRRGLAMKSDSEPPARRAD
ncbi:MAG: permease [Woeseiaceae bacterium]|nr:permease [Woeseiaceae bacterium]